MIKDYFLLASRGIIKRGIRSWLTMLGIFIGIAAIVSLISLGSGMQNAITGQFANLGSDKLTVTAKSSGYNMPGQGVAIPLTNDDAEAIKNINGVDDVITRILEPSKVEINKIIDYRAVASIPEDDKQFRILIDNMNIKVEKGRLIKSTDTSGVMVTYDYYKDNNVFKKKLIPGDTVLIRDKRFSVVGLVAKTGNPLMDSAIVMMENPLRDLIGEKDRVDIMLVVVSKGLDINDIAVKIEKVLRKRRNVDEGKEDFNVQTPKELFETVGTILNVVNIILIGIAAISLVVGGIGIMNTMYTSVVERTKQIGIMKAIGARNSSILTLYLIESGLLGTVGGIVGVIGGIALSQTVVFFAKNAGITLLEANYSPWLIIGALLFSFLVGVLSGVLPARQASKLNPVDALRSAKL